MGLLPSSDEKVGNQKKEKRSLRSATHNCQYFDTQITVKKWRLASLHKFNNLQGTWVLHSGKLCSPSSSFNT